MISQPLFRTGFETPKALSPSPRTSCAVFHGSTKKTKDDLSSSSCAPTLEHRMMCLTMNLLLPKLGEERERSLLLSRRQTPKNEEDLLLRTPSTGYSGTFTASSDLVAFLPRPRQSYGLLQRPNNPVSTHLLDPCRRRRKRPSYQRRPNADIQEMPSSLCLPDMLQEDHDNDRRMMRPRPKRPRLSHPRNDSSHVDSLESASSLDSGCLF